MNRLSWFKRLFMSYEALQAHFASSKDDAALNQSLNDQINLLKQSLIDKDATIADLRAITQRLSRELDQIKFASEAKDKELNEKNSSITHLRETLAEIKGKLDEKAREQELTKRDISDKLGTLYKIEKTFFAQTGNKGKGELGELQVKSILEKSGLTNDFWTENLQVGSSSVEFAIKSGSQDQWIPVDSKVLDAEVDEENNVIIDDSYAKRVVTQAKEVAKYLGKKNTANYGILVLQSDAIYMKLYDKDPSFFHRVISEHKIHIASPSIFVQFAWSISNILDIYERVHNDEKIYEDMIDALVSVEKFANKLFAVHKDFNIAMNSHYPTIASRTNNLTKRLVKSDKLSEVKLLDIKNKEEE